MSKMNENNQCGQTMTKPLPTDFIKEEKKRSILERLQYSD